MTDLNSWLPLVADAHECGADICSENDVLVRRVTGGTNNALYQIFVEHEVYACRLCVNDFRRRAAQEYGTLRLLKSAGLDLAPEPVLLDDGCELVPYPAVVYRWISGAPLCLPLKQSQLTAILDSIQQIICSAPPISRPVWPIRGFTGSTGICTSRSCRPCSKRTDHG